MEKLLSAHSRKISLTMAKNPWPLRLTARISKYSTVTTIVVAACLGLFGQEANALALGRITVLSALGEPLRAEIDIPDINPDELNSLRPSIATTEAFRLAGLEYKSVLVGAQITLQRRADGSSYLRLSSDRIINEPFLDIVIEVKWAAGQLSRYSTLLFDPPLARQNAVTTSDITPPLTSMVSSPQPAAVAIVVPTTTPPAAVAVVVPTITPPAATAPVVTATAPLQTMAARSKVTLVANKEPDQRDKRQVTVQVHAGDTASKIASTLKPTTVSLDQMLVALLRTNPNAFKAGNVNRLRAGSVLDVPNANSAAAVPTAEASQIVRAQSRDFNDFRRKLASVATVVQVDASKRSSSGKVLTQLQDKKPSDASPDKLSLQKGALKDTAHQDKIVKDLRDNDATKRLAELNKNISDLNKLTTAPALSAVGSAPAKSTIPLTAVTVATVAAVTTTKTTTVTASSSLANTSTVPVTIASASVENAPVPVSEVSSPLIPVPAETSLVSDLLDNPWAPAGAGGLLALLAGLAFYLTRQRKKTTQVDSNLMESRLQPVSFFNASNGHKIDTSGALLSGSSMPYSPSQPESGADVDPIAEADVYLAYGRDLQAEEILKEALRSNPSRAAIHFKLLQIFAKRKDVKSYAASAADAYKLTQGLGSEWSAACMTGREIDPTNSLYQSDDFTGIANISAESTAHKPPFPLSAVMPLTTLPAHLVSASPLSSKKGELLSTPTQIAAIFPDSPPVKSSDMVKFDLDSLSLDLDKSAPLPLEVGPSKALKIADNLDSLKDTETEGADPLVTKVASSKEFKTVGDNNGAQTVAQEVTNDTTGYLKAKAKRFLAKLAK